MFIFVYNLYFIFQKLISQVLKKKNYFEIKFKFSFVVYTHIPFFVFNKNNSSKYFLIILKIYYNNNIHNT